MDPPPGFCHITTNLKANLGPICNLQTLRTEPFSDVGDILCPVVKLLELTIFVYSKTQRVFSEEK